MPDLFGRTVRPRLALAAPARNLEFRPTRPQPALLVPEFHDLHDDAHFAKRLTSHMFNMAASTARNPNSGGNAWLALCATTLSVSDVLHHETFHDCA